MGRVKALKSAHDKHMTDQHMQLLKDVARIFKVDITNQHNFSGAAYAVTRKDKLIAFADVVTMPQNIWGPDPIYIKGETFFQATHLAKHFGYWDNDEQVNPCFYLLFIHAYDGKFYLKWTTNDDVLRIVLKEDGFMVEVHPARMLKKMEVGSGKEV